MRSVLNFLNKANSKNVCKKGNFLRVFFCFIFFEKMTVNELNAQLSDILVLLGSIREQLDGSEPSISAAAAMDVEPVELPRGKDKASRRLPAGFLRGATIDGNCFFFKTNNSVYILEPNIYSHLLGSHLTEKQRDEMERVIVAREAELEERYANLAKDLTDGKFDVVIKTNSKEVFNLRGNHKA